ncbi:MAG TPA: NrfD/PsrC family molybdoenzyme membrane anchor subunit [Nitrospirota bacterium]|nr:NrfD/PsrC family molybdoenzyme membrane anchor subunit [Nitrospirota bacterium]
MGKKYNLVMAILAGLAGIGLATWIYQLRTGLIATDMRNGFSWGLYIATWAFFVGTAAGGLVVSSAIYLFGAKQLKPIAKVASLTAFLFAMGAMIILIPDIGRPDRLYYFLLYPNFKSMLPWDVIVLSGYAVVSAIYTYTLLSPDIAARGITVPFIGVVGKRNLSEAELARLRARSDKRAKNLAPVALPLAILIHTVTAWVLATQMARPWWYGGALAPTFIAAALASGPAIVILASLVIYGYNNKLEATYALLAKVSAVASVVMLFIYYNDFVVRFWWSAGREFEALKLVFTRYPLFHATEVVFILLATIIFIKYPKEPKKLVLGSISVIVGVFAHRILLLPPAYNIMPLRLPVTLHNETMEWSYPISVGQVRGTLLHPQKIFMSFYDYFPSSVEILITVGVMAFLGLAFLSLTKMLPVREPGQ